MNQKCKHCQQPILGKFRQVKFCAEKECQKSRGILATKKSYLKHREARLAYSRKYNKEFWTTVKKSPLCEMCQKQFNRQQRGNNAKTCSAKCSFQLRKKITKQINDRNYTRCGGLKKLKHNSCCSEAFTHLNTPHCDFCSKLFKRTVPSQKYCSIECREQKFKQTLKELRANFKQKQTDYQELLNNQEKTPLRI